MDRYRLISVDGHYNEPGDLWTSRVPTEFVERVPRIESFDEGDAWAMEGTDLRRPFGWGACAGKAPGELQEWCRFEEINPGSYDPKARLVEMDADDVDAEVLFPSGIAQWMSGVPDDRLHLAMVRAYNDFVSEFASYEPGRLGGMAVIPSRGVDHAVAEVQRTLAMGGFVGFLLTCYPNGSLEIEPGDDAVWGLIAESGKPVAIHVSLYNTMPKPMKAQSLPGTVHFYDAPNRMLQFIFSGVLDRFPSLTVPLIEVDCGWLPYFAEQADDNYLRHRHASLKDRNLPMLPSEYMRTRFPAAFVNDTYAIANRHRIGVERMMWSNDYPHIVSDWPNSWKTIKAAFADVAHHERELILAGNAARVFAFPGLGDTGGRR